MEHEKDGDVEDADFFGVCVGGKQRCGDADGPKQGERNVTRVAQTRCGDAWAELLFVYIEETAEKLREQEAHQSDDARGKRDPCVLADVVDGNIFAQGGYEHRRQHDPQDDLAERTACIRRHDAGLAENAADQYAEKQF